MSTIYFRTNKWPSHLECWLLIICKNHHCPNTILAHPREGIWEWNGEGGAEIKTPLTSSIAESDRAQDWCRKRANPLNQSIRSLPWLIEEYHLLISLMGHFFKCEWLASREWNSPAEAACIWDETEAQIYSLFKDHAAKNRNWNTHSSVCTHSPRKTTMELEKSTV